MIYKSDRESKGMQDVLEVKHTDLAARLGTLYTKHGKVEVPAFIPVIHPVRQEIPIDIIKHMGFDLVITNAYITMKNYGKEVNKSIHEIINFDKAVMTDSGGYQVLEYGDLDVDHEEVARFEEMMKSDIAVPLDKPTGFAIDREKAVDHVKKTLDAAEATIKMVSNDDIIWVGPIQGGRYLDLVRYSAKRLDELGYQMFALGSPTEIMESYEFKTLAEMIIAAKSAIPINKPLHLFGAGNPLTIPLAVALGCDTFDSASYILYAKDDRYMLPNGTINIRELAYLPCNCLVCSKYKASELISLERRDRIVEIAKHNLYIIKREVDAVKQAIIDGRLWEYVIQKSLSHPKLMKANEVLIENREYLEEGTPLYKDKAIYLMSSIDQFRPEVSRFRRVVLSMSSRSDILLLIPEPDDHPLYSNERYNRIRSMLNHDVKIAYYSPFLGIVPEELSDLYPAAHHLTSSIRFKPDDFPTFKDTFFEYTKRFKKVIVVADEFMKNFIKSNALDSLIVLNDYDEITLCL